jgi:hypothetical protein
VMEISTMDGSLRIQSARFPESLPGWCIAFRFVA